MALKKAVEMLLGTAHKNTLTGWPVADVILPAFRDQIKIILWDK